MWCQDCCCLLFKVFSGVEEDSIFVVLDRGSGRLASMLMGVRALGPGWFIGVAALGLVCCWEMYDLFGT